MGQFSVDATLSWHSLTGTLIWPILIFGAVTFLLLIRRNVSINILSPFRRCNVYISNRYSSKFSQRQANDSLRFERRMSIWLNCKQTLFLGNCPIGYGSQNQEIYVTNTISGPLPRGNKIPATLQGFFSAIFYHISTLPASFSSSLPATTASRSLFKEPGDTAGSNRAWLTTTEEGSLFRNAYREAMSSSVKLSIRNCCYCCHDALSSQ